MSALIKDSRCIVCGSIPSAHESCDWIECYEAHIALLAEACEAAQAVRQSLVSYPDFLTLHITLPKLETALRAAGYGEGV
jgi:hypothetical protein